MQPPTSIFFPDFRGELWKVGPLMRALLQDTVENFQDMQDKSLQEQGQYKRRLLYQQKLDNMRHKLTRFHLILKWMHKHHTRIKKLEVLHNVVTRSEQSFDHVLKGFTQISFEFAEWCEPEWDVDSAVHILSTGSYRLLPTNIVEQCRFVFTLDEEQEKEITEWLNRQIRYKLFSSQIPSGLTLQKLEDGMAFMEMKGEYRVELSLRMGPQEIPPLSDKERVRWSVFGLSILVRAKLMSQLGQEGSLQEVVNSRQEQLLIDFVNQKVRTSRDPLQEMHDIIHNFVLQVLMKVIRTQLSILQTEMGETVHVIQDRKSVVIEMWKNPNEEDDRKYQLETKLFIESATLKMSHSPPNSIMRKPEMRERFSLRRAAVYVPEIIRNVTIFYSNDRLFQLIKSLEGTWPERIRVFDNETKAEISLDLVQKSNSLHFVDVHLFQSLSVRVFVNRFTGNISLEVGMISEAYVKKAVNMINADHKKLTEALELLQMRAVIRSYEILAKTLNRATFVEPSANHPLQAPVLFVEARIFPPAHFAFQIKGKEVLIFESRFGKEINQPLEFRLISNAGSSKKETSLRCAEDVRESRKAMNVLKSLEKDEWMPLLTTKALRQILDCVTEVDWKDLLSTSFQDLGITPVYNNSAVKIEIDGEGVDLVLAKNKQFVTYKYTLNRKKRKIKVEAVKKKERGRGRSRGRGRKGRGRGKGRGKRRKQQSPERELSTSGEDSAYPKPVFHSTIIHQSQKQKDCIEFSIDIRFPQAIKKLIQLIKDLCTIKTWQELFQDADLRGYRIIEITALPVDFILQRPNVPISKIIIQLRPNSNFPNVNVVAEALPPNLPFLTPLLHIDDKLNAERVTEFLRLFGTSQSFTRKFYETKRAFEEGLKEWRPQFGYTVNWTLQPGFHGKDQFLIYSPTQQVEIYALEEKTMYMRANRGPGGVQLMTERVNIHEGLTQIFMNGSIGTINEIMAAKKQLDAIKNQPTCTLDIFTPAFGHGEYPPKLRFADSVDATTRKIISDFYQRFILFPICPRLLSYFGHLLYFVHYSRDNFISILEQQNTLFDELEDFPDSHVLFQLNTNRNIHFNQKNDVWWIYFRIDFLKIRRRNKRPKVMSHECFNLFEVEEVKPLNLAVKYGTGPNKQTQLAIWAGQKGKERLDHTKLKNWMNRIFKEKLSLGQVLIGLTEEFDSLHKYTLEKAG